MPKKKHPASAAAAAAAVSFPPVAVDALCRVADLLESVIAPNNAETLNHGASWRWEFSPFCGGKLRSAPRPRFPALSELRGLDEQIEMLSHNTRQFLRGQPANHALLTGPRGCGKSSAARGVFGRFQKDGLRVVETSPEGLAMLPDLAALIGRRREKFIVFCDDLAFARNNEVFNRMKSALEGAMTAADNLLVYATSNRRHMIPESYAENDAAQIGADDEIHPDEATEEKTALFDRFGLWLPFFAPDWGEYDAIVRHRLTMAGVRPTAELAREARQWAETRGPHNGRAARQFAAVAAGRAEQAGKAKQSPRRGRAGQK